MEDEDEDVSDYLRIPIRTIDQAMCDLASDIANPRYTDKRTLQRMLINLTEFRKRTK